MTNSTSLETSIVRIGSQDLRVACGGTPTATRTLLLFNGLGASIETVAPFVERFEHTRVIVFDVPGLGESPAPWLPYRLRDIARMGAQLLDRLGVESADVMGVSWGGAVAQEFALRHSARCRTLTLAATCAGFVMVPGKPGVVLEMLSPKYYGAGRRASCRGFLFQLLALVGWTSWHWLHKVKAPTLVMMGTDDPFLPLPNGHIVASGVRGAKLETIDSGHLFVLTRPDETARRIERFIDEHAEQELVAA